MKLVKGLLNFGFLGKIERIPRVVRPLLQLLDGRNDGTGNEIIDRNRWKFTADSKLVTSVKSEIIVALQEFQNQVSMSLSIFFTCVQDFQPPTPTVSATTRNLLCTSPLPVDQLPALAAHGFVRGYLQPTVRQERAPHVFKGRGA